MFLVSFTAKLIPVGQQAKGQSESFADGNIILNEKAIGSTAGILSRLFRVIAGSKGGLPAVGGSDNASPAIGQSFQIFAAIIITEANFNYMGMAGKIQIFGQNQFEFIPIKVLRIIF